MPHVVPIAKSIRASLRPAGITNILVALVHFIEFSRQPTLGLEHVDLKRQATAAWRIVQYVLQRRVGAEPTVPIVLAVDLDRWEAWRQCAARHDGLGAHCNFCTVEIDELSGPHIDRTNAQT